MTESTLSLTYQDLLDAVAYLLFGKDFDDLSDLEAPVADRTVHSGYRQFLYPPMVQGMEAGFEWSFLRPVTTITTLELLDEEEEGTGLYAKDQDLPADFGRLIDGFVFAENAQVPSVMGDVGEGRIRNLRASMSEAGRPRVASIRIKASDGTTGQRREVMWYPTPDAEYTLSYRYEALVNRLTVDAPYPLGAMKHAETIRLSCLASAEAIVNDAHGGHWEHFLSSLAASAARDRREGAKHFGHASGSIYDSDNFRGFPNYSLKVSGNIIQ